MESIKEIRNHIDSVQQTLKITNAMYLISSSKLRKARRQLTDVQPYFEKITRTISDILHRTAGVDHVYFDTRSSSPATRAWRAPTTTTCCAWWKRKWPRWRTPRCF